MSSYVMTHQHILRPALRIRMDHFIAQIRWTEKNYPQSRFAPSGASPAERQQIEEEFEAGQSMVKVYRHSLKTATAAYRALDTDIYSEQPQILGEPSGCLEVKLQLPGVFLTLPCPKCGHGIRCEMVDRLGYETMNKAGAVRITGECGCGEEWLVQATLTVGLHLDGK